MVEVVVDDDVVCVVDEDVVEVVIDDDVVEVVEEVIEEEVVVDDVDVVVVSEYTATPPAPATKRSTMNEIATKETTNVTLKPLEPTSTGTSGSPNTLANLLIATK